MDTNTAHRLASTLKTNIILPEGGLTIKAVVEENRDREIVVRENAEGRAERALVKTGRIVFTGGAKGDHSLELSVSDEERIMAHWFGYLEANGFKLEVGTKVTFPSASNWKQGGVRTGRVTKVGPKRVEIAYKFAHGGETTKSVRILDLVKVYPKAG